VSDPHAFDTEVMTELSMVTEEEARSARDSKDASLSLSDVVKSLDDKGLLRTYLLGLFKGLEWTGGEAKAADAQPRSEHIGALRV
jgi:hypothetical protein